MSKALIVITNKEISNLDNYSSSSNYENHLDLLTEFIYESGLSIDINNKTSHELASEIAIIGHIPILVENKYMVPYLPIEVTKDQTYWFKKNYNAVKNFNLMYYALNENGLTSIDSEIVADIPIIELFYKDLKERTKKENIKIKKIGE